MFLNAVSFLLVVFQLFHPVGDRAAAVGAKHVLWMSSGQEVNFHRTYEPAPLRFVISVEDDEDVEKGARQLAKAIFITSFSKTVSFPAAVKQGTCIYRARSSIGESPLFLLHCNFRV